MIETALPLTALIGATTYLAFWLDWKIPALSKLGASLIALILGAVLSNAGVVPATSPVYDSIAGPVTMLAITWLLLAVSLSDLRLAGPRMLAAFAIAVIGTGLGAFVGAFVFAGAIGPDTWKLAGTLSGTYSGGSLNFVAIGRGLELPAELFAGATAADATMTAVWLAANLTLPLWIGRFYARIPEGALAHPEGVEAGAPKESSHPYFVRSALSTLDLAKLMALGLVLLAAAESVVGLMGGLAAGGHVPGWVGGIPSVLWLTTFALAVGHTPWFRKPEGALQLGTVALHFFFVVIGIWSRFSEILAVGLEVFYYTVVVVAVHGIFVYGVGKLARLDVGSLSVASQAAVGGPSSALAVAVSRGWPGFILPGVIVGLLGYAVGTYFGFSVAYLLQGMGVGL